MTSVVDSKATVLTRRAGAVGPVAVLNRPRTLNAITGDWLAARLATKGPAAPAGITALVQDGLERPLAEGLERELDAVLERLGGAAAASGIDTFVTVRTDVAA